VIVIPGRPRPEALAEHLRRAEASEVTYEATGMSVGQADPGALPSYERHLEVGRGDDAFARACEQLRRWRQHRAIAASVHPGLPPLEEGTTLLVLLPLVVATLVVPCRVVAVVDEPDRFGFAYGTLPGHVETGEEAFVVERRPDGEVRFTVRVVAEPATPVLRAIGPLVAVGQRVAVARYLRGLRAGVRGSSLNSS
jgi:uncharacterized protein (UPF0548 family)